MANEIDDLTAPILDSAKVDKYLAETQLKIEEAESEISYLSTLRDVLYDVMKITRKREDIYNMFDADLENIEYLYYLLEDEICAAQRRLHHLHMQLRQRRLHRLYMQLRKERKEEEEAENGK